LIFGDVGDVVEDQQMELVELGNGRFQAELAVRYLQLLDELPGANEQHTPSLLEERMPEPGREVRLSGAVPAKKKYVTALLEPSIARGERHDLRLTDHGHPLEVEGAEGFVLRQLRFGEVAFEPAACTLGNLEFGEGRKEAGRRPTFLVGLICELGPHQFHGRQAQLGKLQLDARGIGARGGLHGRTSSGAMAFASCAVVSSAS